MLSNDHTEDQQGGNVISRSEAMVRENNCVVMENYRAEEAAPTIHSVIGVADEENLSCVVVDNPHTDTEVIDHTPSASQLVNVGGLEERQSLDEQVRNGMCNHHYIGKENKQEDL